jgi:competence protein ComEC
MDRNCIILAFGLALALAASPLRAELEVTFLYVGEGEATLLQSGGKTALIDAGNPATGFRVVEYLRSLGHSKLDQIYITHPHPDHMGGVYHALANLKIEQRFDNGAILDMANDHHRWFHEYYRNKSYRALRPGDTLQLGEAVIKVLNAQTTGRTGLNRNSLVLSINHGENHFLLMGDAGKDIEEALIASANSLQADVLKVGHHGADDATSTSLLKTVQPTFAVISTNKHNVRGYPSDKVINRLRDAGTKVLTTYEQGDISFVSDGKQVTLQITQ